MRKEVLISIYSFLFIFLVLSFLLFFSENIEFGTIMLILCLSVLLAILFIVQFILAIFEKFKVKSRLLLLLCILVSASWVYYMPVLYANQNTEKAEVLMEAGREGAANCYTRLILFKNRKFTESSICFGRSRTRGEYELRGDTIFFKNVQEPENYSKYYEYAVLKKDTLTKVTGFLSDIKINRILLDIYCG